MVDIIRNLVRKNRELTIREGHRAKLRRLDKRLAKRFHDWVAIRKRSTDARAYVCELQSLITKTWPVSRPDISINTIEEAQAFADQHRMEMESQAMAEKMGSNTIKGW